MGFGFCIAQSTPRTQHVPKSPCATCSPKSPWSIPILRNMFPSRPGLFPKSRNLFPSRPDLFPSRPGLFQNRADVFPSCAVNSQVAQPAPKSSWNIPILRNLFPSRPGLFPFRGTCSQVEPFVLSNLVLVNQVAYSSAFPSRTCLKSIPRMRSQFPSRSSQFNSFWFIPKSRSRFPSCEFISQAVQRIPNFP